MQSLASCIGADTSRLLRCQERFLQLALDKRKDFVKPGINVAIIAAINVLLLVGIIFFPLKLNRCSDDALA